MSYFLKAIAILSILIFAGCSSENKPSNSELEKAFTMEIPSYFKVTNFDVEHLGNIGDKLDPEIGSRFEATAKSKVPLFKVTIHDTDLDVVFVKQINKKGVKVSIFGKIRSSSFQGSWRHKIDIDGDPFKNKGNHLSVIQEHFSEKVILEDSEEEKEFTKQVRLDTIENSVSKLFIGKWVSEDVSITLNKDRTFHLYQDDVECHAKWELHAPEDATDTLKAIILTYKQCRERSEEQWGSIDPEDSVFAITYLSGKKMTMWSREEDKYYDYTRK